MNLDHAEFHLTIKDYFTSLPFVDPASGLTTLDMPYESIEIVDQMYETKSHQLSTAKIVLPSLINNPGLRALFNLILDGARVEIYDFQPDCGNPYFAGYISPGGLTEQYGHVQLDVVESLVQGKWQHVRSIETFDQPAIGMMNRGISRWQDLLNDNFTSAMQSSTFYTQGTTASGRILFTDVAPRTYVRTGGGGKYGTPFGGVGGYWQPGSPVVGNPNGYVQFASTAAYPIQPLCQITSNSALVTPNDGDTLILECDYSNNGTMTAHATDLTGSNAQMLLTDAGGTNVIAASWTQYIQAVGSSPAYAYFMAVSSKTTTGVQVSSPAGTSAQSLITDSSGTTNRVTLLCHFTTTGTAIYLYKNNVSAIPIFQSPYSYIGIPLKVQLQANISDAGVFTASTYNFTNLRIRQLENYLAPGAQFSAQTADSVYYSANNEDCVSFLDLFLQKDGSECRTNFYSFPGKDSLDIGPVNGLGTALSQVLGYDDFNPLSGVVRSTIQTAKPILYYRLNDATVNLLSAVDADFETGLGHWTGNGSFWVNAATVTQSTDQASVGTHSMKVVCSGAASVQGTSTANPSIAFKVAPSTQLTLSANVYAPVGATLYLSFRTKLAGDASTDVATNVLFTGTGTWQRVSATITGTASAAYCDFAVRTATTEAITFYVDGVCLNLGTNTTYSAPTTTVADSSTSANTGTIHGGVEGQSSGAVSGGGATLFDGGTGHINTNAALPSLSGGYVTVEAWVYHSAAWSAGVEAIAAASDGTAVSYFYVNGGQLGFTLDIGGAEKGIQSSHSPSLNAWHHLVGVYDGANLLLYVDGVLDTSVAQTGSLVQAAAVWHIGSYYNDAGYFWNGELAEVAVYDYALSAGQIAQHALGLGPYTTPGGISTIAEQGVFLNAPPFRLEEGYNLSEAPVHNASAQPHANEVVYMGSGNTDAQAFADVYSVNEVGNPLAPTNTTFPRKYPYFELLTNDDRSGLISVTRGLAQSQLELSTDITPSLTVKAPIEIPYNGRVRAGDSVWVKTQSLLNNIEQEMRIMQITHTAGKAERDFVLGRKERNADLLDLIRRDMVTSWLYTETGSALASYVYPYLGAIPAATVSWSIQLDQFTTGTAIHSATLHWFTAAAPVSNATPILNGNSVSTTAAGTDSGIVDVTGLCQNPGSYTLAVAGSGTLTALFFVVRIRL